MKSLLLVALLAACSSPRPERRTTRDAFVPHLDSPAPDGSISVAADTPDAGLPSILETTVRTESTGAAGEVAVTVAVADHRSFMLVATTETSALLSVLDITGPDGTTLVRWEDWYEGENNLTSAFYAESTATVINWPIRDEDPPLVPGDYVVRLGSYRADGITARPNVPIEVTSITSRDHDLEHGRMRVVIVWADGLADDDALVAATEGAVNHWREIWEGADMTLDVRYVASTIGTALPYPSAETGGLFDEASSLAEPGEITVLIGESIDGDDTQYGVSGCLPGPIVRSAVSAIVIGSLANAGSDGLFDDGDIRLYGEVLAHEVGHYVGLFHPFEDGYDSWDALADTPECRSAEACEAALATNLMFPYSICDDGRCLGATVLTGDQRAVMQRYTGAL